MARVGKVGKRAVELLRVARPSSGRRAEHVRETNHEPALVTGSVRRWVPWEGASSGVRPAGGKQTAKSLISSPQPPGARS